MKKELLIGLSPNSKLIKEYKKQLTSLNTIQWEASIGLMLGDASLQTQNKGKTYRMKFEWSEKNKAYVYHIYALFDEWVLSKPHVKNRLSPKGNSVTNLGFQTISHKAFNSLAELFFKKNENDKLDTKKSINSLLIKNHLWRL